MVMHRLGIDLRCLPADGSAGAGVAHASRAIVGAMLNSIPKGWTVKLYLPRGAKFDDDLPSSTEYVALTGSRRADLLRGLRESSCDVLFVPSGAVALRLPVPAIPWVHDVDIYKHPEWFGESWLTRMRTTWMFREGLKKAPLIFSVSEYTREEIRKMKIENRIIVTGEGGDEKMREARSEMREAGDRLLSRGVASPYILMLGTVEPRKNIEFGLRSAVDNRWSGSFVVAGRDGWKVDPINRAMDEASKQLKLIRINDVSDELRRDLLIGASIVLVPSLSEGFGLVALEAMQAGVPVIASDRGALPEVAGESILSLDDPRAWSDTIERLSLDLAFRSEWIARQRRDASRFSWKCSAEIVWNALKRK
jgi:glycosyltransferase involved in cell wall biosynthesis